MYFFGAWGCRWGLRDVSILLCNNKNRKESDSWRTSCSSNGKESAGDLRRSLGWEDPLEKRMAIHSSIRDWRIPSTEKPGGYSSWGRKESDTTEWFTHTHRHTHTVGGLLRSGDYQANRVCHGEENMFVATLSLHPKKLGRQVRSVWKIWCGICHGIWQQFFSCLPTTFNNGFGIPFLYRTIQSY